MAVCTFLGNDTVYDADLCDKVYQTLQSILKNHEFVNVLLLPPVNSSGRTSFDLCLLAAVRLRSQHPRKVVITIVSSENAVNSNSSRLHTIPACMVDKVITPIPGAEEMNAGRWQEKCCRWIIEQSTHVVTCLYEKLGSDLAGYWHSAKKFVTAEIIDISSAEVRQIIDDRPL